MPIPSGSSFNQLAQISRVIPSGYLYWDTANMLDCGTKVVAWGDAKDNTIGATEWLPLIKIDKASWAVDLVVTAATGSVLLDSAQSCWAAYDPSGGNIYVGMREFSGGGSGTWKYFVSKYDLATLTYQTQSNTVILPDTSLQIWNFHSASVTGCNAIVSGDYIIVGAKYGWVGVYQISTNTYSITQGNNAFADANNVAIQVSAGGSIYRIWKQSSSLNFSKSTSIATPSFLPIATLTGTSVDTNPYIDSTNGYLYIDIFDSVWKWQKISLTDGSISSSTSDSYQNNFPASAAYGWLGAAAAKNNSGSVALKDGSGTDDPVPAIVTQPWELLFTENDMYTIDGNIDEGGGPAQLPGEVQTFTWYGLGTPPPPPPGSDDEPMIFVTT